MDEAISNDADSYWTVHCISGGCLCTEDQVFVVIVTGSDDVEFRYEDASTAGDGDVARVSATESDRLVAQLMVIDGLPVLQLTAKDGKLDVELLRKERVHRIVNQGSGNIAIYDGVLVTSGPDLTASFSEVKVKTASVEVSSSADATVTVESTATIDSLSLSVQGSGSLCFTADSSIETNYLEIKKIGAGDVSIGPQGSCQDAKLTSTGSGALDIGGIQCHTVNVDLLGSGNVVVQATGSLSGDVYGSGHLKFYGDAPQSIDNINYLCLVTATPVSRSYHPAGCKTKPFPTDSVGVSRVEGKNVGKESSYSMTSEQSNLVYLAGAVFLVALVLRWFNESRRRARELPGEEQRQPLVDTERRPYT
ncbi:putative auto-transporter adhesin head GIN domain-containing protein [Phytophthora infestans]|uniref:Putative auto-transporter adhesin head GIN domain-containing protein n=1 Tax=Phytophthora infestans TaxID=4787 RepID=A0A8S9U0R9_PHYIN|nr:putative auto-transporter adhesin head GIN domain-containing protein [Phytophthora infestans]